MNSKTFQEKLEQITNQTQKKYDAGLSNLLQQLPETIGGSCFNTNYLKNSNSVIPINDIRGAKTMGYQKKEKLIRCKLAAVFRLLDLYGWTQGIDSVITARSNQDQEHFLVNPYGLLYHEVTASSLVKVDMQGSIVEQGTTNFGIHSSNFQLHSTIHAARPDIKCIVHIATPSVTAISSTKCGILPLSQESIVIGEVNSYHFINANLEPEEKEKLAICFGSVNKVMLLTNRGALCCGETVEEAFFNVYNTVLACETQLKLMPLGVNNLALISDEARKSILKESRKPSVSSLPSFASPSELADKLEKYWHIGNSEFEAQMRMLDDAGFQTGYSYRHPLVKSEPLRIRNDIKISPALSSLENVKSRWLNLSNIHQKLDESEMENLYRKKLIKDTTMNGKAEQVVSADAVTKDIDQKGFQYNTLDYKIQNPENNFDSEHKQKGLYVSGTNALSNSSCSSGHDDDLNSKNLSNDASLQKITKPKECSSRKGPIWTEIIDIIKFRQKLRMNSKRAFLDSYEKKVNNKQTDLNQRKFSSFDLKTNNINKFQNNNNKSASIEVQFICKKIKDPVPTENMKIPPKENAISVQSIKLVNNNNVNETHKVSKKLNFENKNLPNINSQKTLAKECNVLNENSMYQNSMDSFEEMIENVDSNNYSKNDSWFDKIEFDNRFNDNKFFDDLTEKNNDKMITIAPDCLEFTFSDIDTSNHEAIKTFRESLSANDEFLKYISRRDSILEIVESINYNMTPLKIQVNNLADTEDSVRYRLDPKRMKFMYSLIPSAELDCSSKSTSLETSDDTSDEDYKNTNHSELQSEKETMNNCSTFDDKKIYNLSKSTDFSEKSINLNSSNQELDIYKLLNSTEVQKSSDEVFHKNISSSVNQIIDDLNTNFANRMIEDSNKHEKLLSKKKKL